MKVLTTIGKSRNCDNIKNVLIVSIFLTALDLKTPAVYEGPLKDGKPDVTMTVADGDLVEIASGALSPQVAYMKGKLKLAGNIMLAQKLGPLLKSEAKM